MGYLASFVTLEARSKGLKTFGITSKINDSIFRKFPNTKIFSHSQTPEALSNSTHLLVSAPPNEKGCPIINTFKNQIVNSNIRCIAYLSSTGVYGDHKGNWVQETSPTNTSNQKGKNRLKAEKDWLSFSNENNLILIIYRLSGIYGPSRNPFIKLKNGTAKLITKKDQYFSRIHVNDAARIILKGIRKSNKNNLWNIADKEPCSNDMFLREAIKISGIPISKKLDYNKNRDLIPLNFRSFWEENKRVSSTKVLKELNISLIFPNYRNGLKYLFYNKHL